MFRLNLSFYNFQTYGNDEASNDIEIVSDFLTHHTLRTIPDSESPCKFMLFIHWHNFRFEHPILKFW